MTIFINIADLKDPDDPEGRTYRQVNAAKKHGIPIGALVELVTEDGSPGVRAFVVYRGRDCDQTPIYWLSLEQEDVQPRHEGQANPGWRGGFSEESLKVITEDSHAD